MTIVGTRPELIRLSLIIKKLDAVVAHHVLVHTGQNYDPRLRDVFFEQLNIRKPDYEVTNRGHSFGSQISAMFAEVERILMVEKPDALLVLGDTNSALCALLGARMQIPVYHMEAGNRCFDNQVPEETNRRVIDTISHFNLPYTPGSRENLLREGIPSHRIWVSGNPIFEVIEANRTQIEQSHVLSDMKLHEKDYVLVTAHRAENVDNPRRLEVILDALHTIAVNYDTRVVVSVHPRTRERLKNRNMMPTDERLIFAQPFGFWEFVNLQMHAKAVITDSGTVQEESCILGVPSVTIRQSTERPETILCGSTILSGVQSKDRIVDCFDSAIQLRSWPMPEGYVDKNVSTKVLNFILGGLHHV